ncbi:MAG: GNAT family N-acetyltransferase [Pseudomonadota bacterium]
MDRAEAQVERIGAEALAGVAEELAGVLRASVLDGASLGFVAPFSQEDAARYWREEVGPTLSGPDRALWVARAGGAVIGTVQLDCAAKPNQPHRAEVMKLMVAPERRRLGAARALMAALEAEARARGRWLLTLDTASPETAERLYLSLGYARAGAIPAYARHPTEDAFEPTVFMWKRLDGV